MRTGTPGDGALLRRVAGDWRSVIDGLSIGILQLMLPPLGAAVATRSDFLDDPFGRIYRSLPQIWATVLAPDAPARARELRDRHRTLHGSVDGRRWSALDPETFWWAHATFTHLMLTSVQRYHRPGALDLDGLDHLYADTVEWYRSYGVSMQPVPATRCAFEERFADVCAQNLEVTPAVTALIEVAGDGVPELPAHPTELQRITGPILRRWGRTATLGGLPPAIREQLGFAWDDEDARRHRRYQRSLQALFCSMPRALNRATFERALRRTGAQTKDRRYAPPSGTTTDRRPRP